MTLHPRGLLPLLRSRLAVWPIIKEPQTILDRSGPARLLSERMSLDDGPIFETFVLDELIRWSSWQPDPPNFHFYRTHAGREVDFIVRSSQRLIGIEVKVGRQVHAGDARPLVELLETTRIPSLSRDAERLGLVVYRGREAKQLLLISGQSRTGSFWSCELSA
jgi:predicted AAA+ superfamily ATPase